MDRTAHSALQTLSEAMDSPYFMNFMSDDFLTAQIHAWLETETIKATPHSWSFGMVDLTVDSKGMIYPNDFEISVLEDDWNDWHYRAVAKEMAEAIHEQALQLSAPEPTWREYWNHHQVQNLKNQIHYFLHPYGFSVSDDLFCVSFSNAGQCHQFFQCGQIDVDLSVGSDAGRCCGRYVSLLFGMNCRFLRLEDGNIHRTSAGASAGIDAEDKSRQYTGNKQQNV